MAMCTDQNVSDVGSSLSGECGVPHNKRLQAFAPMFGERFTQACTPHVPDRVVADVQVT